MRVSREQVAENRRKILDAASRLFRARGFEAVTVAEVMKAAGLTHGGFYGHFKSKDDLIAQALVHVLTEGAPDQLDIGRYAKAYLAPRHRDDLEGGCPVAGLGAETIRQGPEAKAAMTQGLKLQIERFMASAPGETTADKRRAAIGAWAAMVGGVVLARMSDDLELSDEVLAATRGFIDEAA